MARAQQELRNDNYEFSLKSSIITDFRRRVQSLLNEELWILLNASMQNKVLLKNFLYSFKDLKYGIPYQLILKQLQAFILSNDWWKFF